MGGLSWVGDVRPCAKPSRLLGFVAVGGFGLDGAQITVCSSTGDVVDQVKVKSRPVALKVRRSSQLVRPLLVVCSHCVRLHTQQQFGRKALQPDGSLTLCINMDGRSLILHDLSDRSNAIELMFRPTSVLCCFVPAAALWCHIVCHG